MTEIWKDIAGYENFYKISSIGRVKSLERKVKYKNGSIHIVREKILKPSKDKGGYLVVGLCKNGKMKTMKVHRLVCDAFIINQDNLPQVNHKDECKTNNCVENLEYCTQEYNNKYGTHIQRVAKAHIGIYNTKTSKKVKCLETGKIYPSLAEVQRQLGLSYQGVGACCNGKLKTCGRLHWKFVD